MMVDTSDLVTATQLAEKLGVSRATVSTWEKGRDEKENGFPAPVAGNLYSLAACTKWRTEKTDARAAKARAACRCPDCPVHSGQAISEEEDTGETTDEEADADATE